ncbi:2-5A-dependent ribonuclease-like [Epinephelus moara]|uniref:2-5A-dependent ribonuclease-like n=1 Tax=Epinephelus moara TaxID=300413 RepID=UPI00214EF019|nr:2-5A-dependent ribonuclease-like [Epinephelus moara]XP_049897391.1 2-5A-dependent ribonuclease-like [Epinephelus moara]
MRPRRICPEKEALQFIASGKDKDTFEKKFINEEKGYGVFANKNIEPGEFLLEYVGRHITGPEGEDLFKEYADVDAAFLYFYSFQGQTFCVDGSKTTERLGRFINDDHINPNSKIKIILDEQKTPHLCAFAITKINAGEEIVYDYGDPNCPWRHESRWKKSFENLDSKPGMMKIDGLTFNTTMKIANGCNAAEIFAGLYQNRLVAVKRVAKHISKHELEMAYFLCSGNLQGQHLLQPIAVLEDTYFAYFVSPLCEYSLLELIENKNFPARQSLTENQRLKICQELLLGLQELHSHGILHRDLKPKIFCLISTINCISQTLEQAANWILHKPHCFPKWLELCLGAVLRMLET